MDLNCFRYGTESEACAAARAILWLTQCTAIIDGLWPCERTATPASLPVITDASSLPKAHRLVIQRFLSLKYWSIAPSIVSAVPFMMSLMCKNEVLTPLSVKYRPTSTNCFKIVMSVDSSVISAKQSLDRMSERICSLITSEMHVKKLRNYFLTGILSISAKTKLIQVITTKLNCKVF